MLPRLSRRGTAVARALAVALCVVEAIILARLYLPRLLSSHAELPSMSSSQCPVRPLVNPTPTCPAAAAPITISPLWAPVMLAGACPGCLACPSTPHTSPALSPATWHLAALQPFSFDIAAAAALTTAAASTAFSASPLVLPPFSCSPALQLVNSQVRPGPLTSDPDTSPEDRQALNAWMQHQHELSQTSLWQSEWSVPALMQPSHGFWSASLQQQAEQAGPETATVSATATSAAESAGAATATTLLSSPGSSEVDVPSEALAAHSAAFLNAVSRSPALLSSLLPSKPSQGPVSDLIHPKSTLARLLLALPSSLQPSALLARLSTSFISLYGSSAADAVASSQDADTQEDALLAVIAEAYAVAGADSEEVGSLDTTVAATIAGPYLDASIYARDLNAADPSANPAPPALSSGTHLDSTWDAPAPGPASAPTSTIMVSPWGMAIGLAAAIGLLVIARLGMPALAQAMTPATPLAATAPYGYRLAQQSGGQGYAPSLGYASGIGGSAQARPWWQSPFPSPLSTRGTTVAAAAAAAASPQGEAQREAEANRDGEGGRRLSFPTWFSPWGGQLTSAAVTPASLCLSPVTLGSLRGLALPSSPPSTLASGGLAPRTGGFSGMSGGSALSGLLASCGGASQGLGRRFSLSPLGSVLAALSPVEVAPPSPEDEAGAEQELEEGQEDIGLAVARELLQGGDGECDAYAGALGAMDEGAWDDGLDGGAGAAMQLPETQDLVPTSGRYAAASPYLPGAPAASSPASSLLGSPAVLSAAKAVADMLPSPLSSLLTGGKPTGSRYNTRTRRELAGAGGTLSQSVAFTEEGGRDSDGAADSEAVSKHTPGSTVKAVANGLLGSAQKAGRILTRSARKATRQLDTVLDDDERPGDQDWEWGTASQDLGPAPAAAKTQADSGRPTRGSRRAGGR